MMALVLELNLLASSSWSRTQSLLVIMDVAVGFYRTSQLGDMVYFAIMIINIM